MAEPWSRDFDALDARSRHGLRSLDATRTALSQPQETKMRFFKTHPALAALFVFVALGFVSGAAYAVVHEVWISIDAHESPPQIEQDVQDQLAAQGVTGTVTAEKTSDGKLKIKIMDTGSAEPDVANLHIAVNGTQTDMQNHGLRVNAAIHLDDAQSKQLVTTASCPEMQAALAREDGSADARADAIAKVFVAHGFQDVDVQPTGDGFVVTIKAPPTP